MPNDPNLDQLAADVPALLTAVGAAVALLAAGAANSQPDPRAAALHEAINGGLNALNAAINTASGKDNPAPAPASPTAQTPASLPEAADAVSEATGTKT